MDHGHPPSFATLPPAAWPLESISYVAAMGPADIAQVVLLVIGGLGGSSAILGRFLWAKWEASNARQVAILRQEVADLRIERDEHEADLRAEREDRGHARERNQAEAESLRKVVSDLRAQMAEKDRVIAERDAQIRYRDHSVEENTRRIQKLGDDLAAMSTAFLIFKGDARAKE